MCGICGFNWNDKTLVKKMADEMNHRGPDQDGFYTDNLVSLAHKRLSIIDLSEKGRQPMCNENGNVWIIYNGEIYNFREIKDILEKKGHQFHSHTDTEVIIHAYEEWGVNCLKFFNGMFAFAIWDSTNKKLFLARDRLGIKPLFYFFDRLNNKFIFSSEIKSMILNPLIKKELNLSGLSQLIYYAYTINAETMINNIYELPPGHFAIYDFHNLIIEKYWGIKNNISYENEYYLIKKFEIELKESINKRLVADVPLGASLSGGIDSSSIVALMSKMVDEPVKTFTVGFNDESDEFAEARRVAEFCKTDHHEKIIDFKDITKNLAKILWHMEIPFAKPAVFATYFLSREINQNNITIDLAGEGADELLCGYNRYAPYLDKQLPLEEKANRIVSSFFPSYEQKISFFSPNILFSMNSSFKPENIFLSKLENEDCTEHINTALNFEINNQLPGIHLSRTDRMSMANSHELRVPFLDHKFVEFCMTIPSSLKWKGDNKKYILQQAMIPFLPKETINRKKIPFHIPLLKYFQGEFVEIAQNLLSESSIFKKGFVKKEKTMDQIQRIKNKTELNDMALRQILFLTNFELFNKIFIENEKVENLNF